MAGTSTNATPNQAVRVPDAMWTAFGRVCKRQRTNRNARIVEMISAEIREHGDDQDHAALETALAELKARRSRKGIRHSPEPCDDAGQDPLGTAADA